jgi:hypothetical protein
MKFVYAKNEPVRDVFVESVEQTILLAESAPFEHLLRLDLAFAAEVFDHQMAHLVTMTRLFHHDAHERRKVVLARRVVDEKALLFVGRELGVALIDDHVEHRVAHPLIRNLSNALPPAVALEIAEVNFRRGQFSVLRFKAIAGHEAVYQLPVEPDVAPPFLEHADPIVEGRYFRHGTSI